jgi:hypothetical protein
MRIARAQAARPFNDWINRPENADIRESFRNALAENRVVRNRRIARVGAIVATTAAAVVAAHAGDYASALSVFGGAIGGVTGTLAGASAHSTVVNLRQNAMLLYYDRLTPQLKTLFDQGREISEEIAAFVTEQRP